MTPTKASDGYTVSAFENAEGDNPVIQFDTTSEKSAQDTYELWVKSRKYARVCIDNYDSSGEWMSGEWWLRASSENETDQCGGAAGRE